MFGLRELEKILGHARDSKTTRLAASVSRLDFTRLFYWPFRLSVPGHGVERLIEEGSVELIRER